MNVVRTARAGLVLAGSAAILGSVCAIGSIAPSTSAEAAPRQPRTPVSTNIGTTKGTTGRPVSNTRPRSLAIKYATTTLILRSSPADSYQRLGEAPAGSEFTMLGKAENGRAQVLYQGNTYWVSAQYLADSPSGSGGGAGSVTVIGLEGLRPSTRNILEKSKVRWPQVTTYMGVRPDSLSDHPSGRALDIMIPNYRTNTALGDAIAAWARSNAAAFNIDYIIWNQRIWSVARSGEGWRYMADRGSDTANHKDHVHISVRS